VYYANIAAAFLKLEKWKDAEEAATSSLVESGDEKPQGSSAASGEKSREEDKDKEGDDANKEEEAVEEIPRDDVVVNWKARLRRAKAREMVGSWASLQDSLDGEETITILCLPFLPSIVIERTKSNKRSIC